LMKWLIGSVDLYNEIEAENSASGSVKMFRSIPSKFTELLSKLLSVSLSVGPALPAESPALSISNRTDVGREKEKGK